MSVSQKELAARWGLSEPRVSQLVKEGMPTDTFEAAEQWRNERHATTGIAPKGHIIGNPASPALQEITVPTTPGNDGFDAIVQKQEMLVDIARSQYVKAVRESSPQQSRLYASFDKTLKTLRQLKQDQLQMEITKRIYIKTEVAQEKFGRILNELRQRLDQAELDVAPKANPENPAKAMKAFRDWKQKFLLDMSKMEQNETVTPRD